MGKKLKVVAKPKKQIKAQTKTKPKKGTKTITKTKPNKKTVAKSKLITNEIINVDGTSFFGIDFISTQNDIEKIFGKPTIHNDDIDDKTQNEWRLKTDNGNVFAIYDWKVYQKYPPNLDLIWHVGHFKEATDDVKEYLTKLGFKI